MKDKFDIDYDVRVVERNIRDSKITRKDYDKQLDALDDLTEFAEPLVIEDDTDPELQESDEQTEESLQAGEAPDEVNEGEES